nr:2347_t:CDS:2 [Entrophospora candida]
MDDYDYERYEDEIYKENVTDSERNSIGGINNFNAANVGGSNNPRLDDMATHIITPIKLKNHPGIFHPNKKMRADLDDDNYNGEISFTSGIPRESGCSWCNETTHTEEVCESQLRIHEPWRQYKLEDPPANHRPRKVYCFKCASPKHTGQAKKTKNESNNDATDLM